MPQQIVTATYAELAVEVRKRVTLGKMRLIAVDGARTAGKSYAAKDLARDVGGIKISVDDCLSKVGVGSYVDRVDQIALSQAVSAGLQEHPLCILEGLCMLDVLSRLEVAADLHIYVGRVDSFGDWAEIDLFDEGVPLERILETIGFPTTAGAAFDRDIAVYHKRMKPHLQAHIVFKRSSEA